MKSYPDFEKRIPEIHSAVIQVLNRIMRTYPNPEDIVRRYYMDDYTEIPKAYNNAKSGPREYAKKIELFLTSLEFQ